MRLLASGVRKLVRRLATFVTFGLLAGLLVLIMLAVGATANRAGGSEAQRAAALALVTFPAAYDSILAFMLGLGGLLAVTYGAAIAGSEWTWGTLKNAVARGESRSRYMLVSFAAVAIVIAIGLLAVFVVGIGAAIVGANLAGVPTSGIDDAETLRRLPEQIGRGTLAVVEEGALGFTIATLARSQLAGIGAGIALYFGESFARLFLPDIVKFLPFTVANSAIATGAGGGFGGGGGGAPPIARLEPDVALALVVAWLVGSLLVTAIVTERAEISG
jgi:hypothetical protein